jgi:hypothetical protein
MLHLKITLLGCTLALSACAAFIFNSNYTSFERVGSQSCPNADPSDQGRLIGTARDPLRCGPKQQTILRESRTNYVGANRFYFCDHTFWGCDHKCRFLAYKLKKPFVTPV